VGYGLISLNFTTNQHEPTRTLRPELVVVREVRVVRGKKKAVYPLTMFPIAYNG